MNTLQSIPAKQRTAKVHMALAKLFHEQGHCRAAIGAYKEVLRVSLFMYTCYLFFIDEFVSQNMVGLISGMSPST